MHYCPNCRTPLTHQSLAGRERLACPAIDCGFLPWELGMGPAVRDGLARRRR